MGGQQSTLVLQKSRVTAGAGIPSDGQLLHRFHALKDEAAFAALVERHGPHVLAACRQVLGQIADVEDAFQATFLVLVKKASSIRQPDLLGNWLYGVAQRISRKAKVKALRRQKHEQRAAPVALAELPPDGPGDDIWPIIDQELQSLPDKYRAAVVLCYLQGLTNEEAAQRLRWPTGTVKGRLSRARDLLRSRLARRGVVVSAALLAVWLYGSRVRAAAVPTALTFETVRAGLDHSAASPEATSLAESLLRSLRWKRWLLALALVLGGMVGAAAAANWTGLVGTRKATLWHGDGRKHLVSPESPAGACRLRRGQL